MDGSTRLLHPYSVRFNCILFFKARAAVQRFIATPDFSTLHYSHSVVLSECQQNNWIVRFCIRNKKFGFELFFLEKFWIFVYSRDATNSLGFWSLCSQHYFLFFQIASTLFVKTKWDYCVVDFLNFQFFRSGWPPARLPNYWHDSNAWSWTAAWKLLSRRTPEFLIFRLSQRKSSSARQRIENSDWITPRHFPTWPGFEFEPRFQLLNVSAINFQQFLVKTFYCWLQ